MTKNQEANTMDNQECKSLSCIKTSDYCVFCNSRVEYIFVHGHYQCPVCKQNAIPCCNGEQA